LRNIKKFRDKLAGVTKDLPPGTPVEIWFQDEARIGRKNKQACQWARKGARPRQPAGQRHESAYIFGAVCAARDKGAALVMPYVDAQAMQLHPGEISRCVAKGAHAVVLMDGAGWHKAGALKTPENLTLMFIPPYAPELNPAGNIWRFLRQNYLSNRVFETCEDILDACCKAWNALTAGTGRITSIAKREWANA